MKGLKFWLNNARKIALPQSALPCLTAIVLSIGQDGFCWLFAIPVFLGVCAAHLGMNLADDLFDYRKGLPSGEIRSTLVAEGSVRARMEKCAYILSGEATEKDLRRAVILFLGFAGLMGLGVVAGQFFMNGPGDATAVAAYALGGLILGIEYSGAPLRLGYHGLGEVVIGLIFGPLNILGTAAAMTGTAFRADLLLFSLGVGCLVTNIVYVHSVMETGADRRLGKFTFAHLLRSNTSRTAAVALLALLPFVFLAADILFFDWSPWFLLTLATVPMSLSLVLSTWKFVNGKPRKDIPRWWMGPMGDWKAAVDAGLDWFLFRWLLARNIDTFFCLTVIIVHICLVI